MVKIIYCLGRTKMLLYIYREEQNKQKHLEANKMTINEMMNEMEKTLKEIGEIATEIKYRQKDKMEQFTRVMKHSQEWAFVYTQRVMTNHRKAEIEVWYNQSKIALKRAKKIQAS